MNRMGKQTITFSSAPKIRSYAAAVGKKEGDGPLRDGFDRIYEDDKLGQDSWEKAESELQKAAFSLAAEKAGLAVGDCDFILGGDLLNQCVGTAFAQRESGVPFLGLYGACSTMAESLFLGSILVDGGYGAHVLCGASSHFCSAERQYRFPLAYGGQRPPTAQWTATAAGSVLLDRAEGAVSVTRGICGKIVDMGVKDANNMGAAMAPAAYDTLKALWEDTGTGPEDYDFVLTGDLGVVGSSLLAELFSKDGVDLSEKHLDGGVMLFDETQDVHAGGSGCGCSAAVLCGRVLRDMAAGKYHRVIFAATGALMSPTTVQQGESIPGICHGLVLEA